MVLLALASSTKSRASGGVPVPAPVPVRTLRVTEPPQRRRGRGPDVVWRHTVLVRMYVKGTRYILVAKTDVNVPVLCLKYLG